MQCDLTCYLVHRLRFSVKLMANSELSVDEVERVLSTIDEVLRELTHS